MAQITCKELSALSDLLTMEQNLVAKYTHFAEKTENPELSNCYRQIAQKHQRHFDELYSNLK